MKTIVTCGARPNFVKVAPLMRAFDRLFETILVASGQHCGDAMSRCFFEDLDIAEPDYRLGVGPGTQAVQLAGTIEGFDAVLERERPDLVVVVGDVTSTLGFALAADRRRIPIAHVEAGLRSGDWEMPEERNRVLVDRLSDILLTSEPEAMRNLDREFGERGLPDTGGRTVRFVGNTMIDSLVYAMTKFGLKRPDTPEGLGADAHALVTVHRPGNTDDSEAFGRIVDAVEVIQRERPVVFPVHPRTLEALRRTTAMTRLRTMRGVHLSGPLRYGRFLTELVHAAVVVTDSGGLQEECAYLGVPCLTVRDDTERPVTLDHGNRLVGPWTDFILEGYRDAVAEGYGDTRIEGWDGKAAGRVAEVLAEWGGARTGV